MRTVNFFKCSVLAVIMLFIATTAFSQNPALEVISTAGGFVAPNMTQAQRTALSAVQGNLVWQNDGVTGYYYYQGLQWVRINDATALTGIVPVVNGGTGVGTFTLNGILYGNGTSPVLATPASTAANQVIVTTAAGGAPTFQSLGGVTQTVYKGLTNTGVGGAQAAGEASVVGYTNSITTGIYYSSCYWQGYTGANSETQIKMPKCVITRIHVFLAANGTATGTSTFRVVNSTTAVTTAFAPAIPATPAAGVYDAIGYAVCADGDLISISNLGSTAAGAIFIGKIEITYYLLP